VSLGSGPTGARRQGLPSGGPSYRAGGRAPVSLVLACSSPSAARMASRLHFSIYL
jgi:hypothetical protein